MDDETFTIPVSQFVNRELQNRMVRHGDTFDSVIRKLLECDRHKNDNSMSSQKKNLLVTKTVSQPHSTSLSSPRKNRGFVYRVLGHEYKQGAYKGSQFAAFKHIVELISAQTVNRKFCDEFSQVNFTRCIARSEKEIDPYADPQPINLNGEKWLIHSVSDLTLKIKFIIVACHVANFKYGEDVVLLDGWNYPDTKGKYPKNAAEQWARGKGFLS